MNNKTLCQWCFRTDCQSKPNTTSKLPIRKHWQCVHFRIK